jgi:uncharacterized membrane protein
MPKNFLVTLTIFLGIDFLWLGIVAKNFYTKHLSTFDRTINWPAVIITYLIIALGLSLFVLPKAGGNTKLAFLEGAIFGLIVYGVYDLTNLATLKNWSLTMVIVDMLWGMFVCGITSYIVSYLRM